MPYNVIDEPGESWMSIEQAKAAYPNLFSAEGRPEGEADALVDFLQEMDCVIAPIQDLQNGTEPSSKQTAPMQQAKPI